MFSQHECRTTKVDSLSILKNRLRIVYKHRNNGYDICRFVHVSLQFDYKNLFLLIKYQQPFDIYKYLKIRLTDMKDKVTSHSTSVLIGQNVLQLLQQLKSVIAVNLVVFLELFHVGSFHDPRNDAPTNQDGALFGSAYSSPHNPDIS